MKTLYNYIRAWFTPKQWTKIGEAEETNNYSHKLYAVMEHVKKNGDRRYKKVLICTWGFFCKRPQLDSHPEDPLKEINKILNG